MAKKTTKTKTVKTPKSESVKEETQQVETVDKPVVSANLRCRNTGL